MKASFLAAAVSAVLSVVFAHGGTGNAIEDRQFSLHIEGLMLAVMLAGTVVFCSKVCRSSHKAREVKRGAGEETQAPDRTENPVVVQPDGVDGDDEAEPPVPTRNSELLVVGRSRPSTKLKICFTLSSLFYMWPYHTLLQSQTWLATRISRSYTMTVTPDEGRCWLMMALFWPMVFMHAGEVWMSQTLPMYRNRQCKLITGAGGMLAIGAAFLVLMILVPVTDGLTVTFIALTALFSMAECILEPLFYDMAGREHELLVDYVQIGNGLCGVVVAVFQAFVNWATMDDLTDELKIDAEASPGAAEVDVRSVLSKISQGSMDFIEDTDGGFVSSELVNKATLDGFSRSFVSKGWENITDTTFSDYFVRFCVSWNEDKSTTQTTIMLVSAILASIGLFVVYHVAARMLTHAEHAEEIAVGDTEANEHTRRIWKHLSPSILAQCLCFTVSLAVWPVFPMTTPNKDKLSWAPWWDIAIILTYNVADFAGKSLVDPLQRYGYFDWPPVVQLIIALGRFVFFPILFLVDMAPDLVITQTIPAIIAAVGFSNGVLCTISMKSVPKEITTLVKDNIKANALIKRAMSVTVLALFLGLGLGSGIATFVVKFTPRS